MSQPDNTDIQQDGVISAEVSTNEVIENVTSSEVDWKSQVSEEYRESVNDFKDLDGLVKSYNSAQSMLGNSIRIPGEDASEEARAEFYEKLSQVPGVARLPDMDNPEAVNQFYQSLGRPETAEGYKFELPEGVELDGEALGNFRDLAHSIGLTNEQANKLAEFEASRYQAYEQNLSDSRVEAENTLKQEWGNDYESRLTGAKEVINMYKDKYPEAIQDLVQGPAGNNPAFLNMLSELYGSLKESGTITPQQGVNYGVTPEEAKEKINEIYENTAHPYHNDNDPNHRQAVEKMAKLFQAAYPDS